MTKVLENINSREKGSLVFINSLSRLIDFNKVLEMINVMTDFYKIKEVEK